MGSTGHGRFENYDDTKINGGERGASSESCPQKIEDISLEDVSTCLYFSTYHNVPKKGEAVILNPTIEDGRLVIMNQKFETLGNLPTQYHFLLKCLEQGMHYEGNVKASGLAPIPFIVVDLYAK